MHPLCHHYLHSSSNMVLDGTNLTKVGQSTVSVHARAWGINKGLAFFLFENNNAMKWTDSISQLHALPCPAMKKEEQPPLSTVNSSWPLISQ